MSFAPRSTQFRRINFATVALMMLLLGCFIRVDAQSEDTTKAAGKTVNILVTDEQSKPLTDAKVTLVTGCPCDPCKERKVPCWQYCCSPGKYNEEMVTTATTNESGIFSIAAGRLTPGEYRIKVEQGSITKDIDIKVEENHEVKLMKAPAVRKIDLDDAAFQIRLTTAKPGATSKGE
jgi:hypothetical protein